jgi:hypothetical protein
MLFGNLTDVLEGEKPIYEAMADNIITNSLKRTNNDVKVGRISKIL